MQYNPRGQMIRETFGTNTALYQRKHYNRRGQLFDIRLGTDSSTAWDVEDPQIWQWANGSWNRGALRLFYSPNLNDYSGPNPAQPLNNGNIHRMDHFVPNALSGDTITSWVMGSDDYLYDELNRLTRVAETPTGGTGSGFVQQFTYDRWGNRKIDVNATTNLTGITRIDFKVLTANNRLVAPSDVTGDDPGTDLMRYDKAGNLVWDYHSAAVGQRGSMTYDAENRMLTAVSGSHQYRYDADGKRTRRLVAGSPEMWLVYGVSGELVAEYDALMPGGTLKKEYGYRGGQMLIVYDGTLAGDEQLKWMVTDHLGSTRMLVNRSGNLSGIQRRDYLPFGEELPSTVGHRNASGAGYVGGNNPRQKFTGKERDGETGLDYFLARYYSSIQGRFTNPDIPFADQSEGYPQSWNLYAFVRNNPLSFIDPTGNYTCRPDGSCVGDYDGERDGNLYWNKEKQLWEGKKEYQTRLNARIDRLAERAYLQHTYPNFFGRGIDPSLVRNIPTGEVPQRVPIVSGYRDFANGQFGATLMAITPVPFPSKVLVLGRILQASAKIIRQAPARGWTKQMIQEAVEFGKL